MKILGKYSPEEYAGFWGADPVYCKPPQKPADGYLFYDLSACEHDRAWYEEFIQAIDRMIESVKAHPASHDPDDIEGLTQLKAYVQDLIQE